MLTQPLPRLDRDLPDRLFDAADDRGLQRLILTEAADSSLSRARLVLLQAKQPELACMVAMEQGRRLGLDRAHGLLLDVGEDTDHPAGLDALREAQQRLVATRPDPRGADTLTARRTR
jgi:hypothetical protein